LRSAIQSITNLINGFGNLDPAMQRTIMTGAGLTGGTLLLAGGLLTVIPKIHESAKAIEALKAASPPAADALGKVSKAAGIAAGALVALQVANAVFTEKHTKSAEDYGEALLKVGKSGQTIDPKNLDSLFNSWDKFAGNGPDIKDLAGAVKEITNPHIAAGVQDTLDSLFSWTGSAKNDLGQVRDRLSGLGDAMGNLVKSGGAETAAKSFQALTKEFEKNGKGAQDALDYLPGYRDALKGLANDLHVNLEPADLLNLAMGKIPQKMLDAQNSTEGQAKMAEIAKQATEEQAKALDNLGIAADGTILHLDKLIGSMQSAGLLSISADQAAINYQKSLEQVDAMVRQNGQTLDIHSKAGKENMEAWLGQASAADAVTLANAKNGASSAELQVTLTEQYTKLRDNAIAFGKGGDEADAMARKALGIPKDVKIETAIQNYANTMAQAQDIKNKLDEINNTRVATYIDVIERRSAATVDDPNKLGGHFADGGALDSAPGPKGVDSKLFWGAKGEHVLADEDVDAMGGQQAVYAFRKQLHNGGGVRPMYAAAAPAAASAATSGSTVVLDLHGYSIDLNADATMGTFHRIAGAAASGAINAANQDASRRAAR
jgi:hypothetical protein